MSYVSSYMTLMPGDVIATGTPPGVGLGKKPNPVFLKPGDVMTLGIQGLGQQRQKVVALPPQGDAEALVCGSKIRRSGHRRLKFCTGCIERASLAEGNSKVVPRFCVTGLLAHIRAQLRSGGNRLSVLEQCLTKKQPDARIAWMNALRFLQNGHRFCDFICGKERLGQVQPQLYLLGV